MKNNWIYNPKIKDSGIIECIPQKGKIKMKKYQIIYADPPWTYKTKECLCKTSILNGKINRHYNTMSLNDLKKLNISRIIDDDCLLYLWVVSPMLDDCIDLLKAWGFRYSTIGFVWHKQKTNPGHYTMSECEIVLIGRKGKIPLPRGKRNIRQFLSEMREKHSAKPNEIRNRIAKMFPTQNKLELFARQKTEGWDCIGNGINGKDIRQELEEMISGDKNDY